MYTHLGFVKSSLWNDSLITLLPIQGHFYWHNRPIKQRLVVKTTDTTLLGNPDDREGSRLMSENNGLVGVWIPVSFTEHRKRGGKEEK